MLDAHGLSHFMVLVHPHGRLGGTKRDQSAATTLVSRRKFAGFAGSSGDHDLSLMVFLDEHGESSHVFFFEGLKNNLFLMINMVCFQVARFGAH